MTQTRDICDFHVLDVNLSGQIAELTYRTFAPDALTGRTVHIRGNGGPPPPFFFSSLCRIQCILRVVMIIF